MAAEAVAVYAAISSAIKACGSLIEISPSDFKKIVRSNPEALYVSGFVGIFSKQHRYLTCYRGLTFHCKTPTPIGFPDSAQVIQAKRIAIPEM